MSVLAIVIALLPSNGGRSTAEGPCSRRSTPRAGWLEHAFNGGERGHGMVAWLVAVLPPVAAAIVIHHSRRRSTSCSRLAFNVAVLYLTLGFRQFSHHFTELQLAVKSGDIERARGAARGVARRFGRGAHPGRSDPARDRGSADLLAAARIRRDASGTCCCPGRAARSSIGWRRCCAERWRPLGGFGRFAEHAFELIEWPAVRLTAASFAVVGDFEDSIYCWRTQARAWAEPNEGVVLAAGAGAMGVRLGMPVQEVEGMQPRPELGVGEPADGPFLDSTVGLVWRALVLWVFVVSSS